MQRVNEAVIAFVDEAEEDLKKAGIESPRVNAELLFAHALGVKRFHLYSEFRRILPRKLQRFYELVDQRSSHIPLQYLIGSTEFMDATIKCAPCALIPRPETEGLTERVIQFIKERNGDVARVLEIGTGTGCIAIALAMAFPKLQITATDCSSEALSLARENAMLNKVQDQIFFLQADLFPPDSFGPFDLIVSNPPYVAESDLLPDEVRLHEPATALFAGPDGLSVIERILERSSAFLVPKGQIFIEIGETQGSRLASNNGWGQRRIERDLAGRDRYLIIAS